MTRTTRKIHAALWCILVVALPCLLVLGWRDRRPVVLMDRLPESLINRDLHR